MSDKDRIRYQNDGAKDVADIWSDAIRQYQGIGGKDLKAGYNQFKSVETMIEFGCQEMENFHAFRYDDNKVSKLRGLFKDGMWLIEGGMQQVVTAATPAFPPAAAIGTALTYMLTACKEVSADYDVVTTFFIDFTMFLRRMKILEKRLPKEGAFHDCVFDVFASLLTMCGTATKYIELKRFKKWVTALFKGGDEELVDARKGMDTAMSNLRDVTEKAILGNTVDLQRSSGETYDLLQQMEQELQENSESTRQVMEEHFSLLQEMTAKQNAIYNDVKKLLEFEQDRRRNDSLSKQSGSKPSGNAKPPTSNSVRISFGYTKDPEREYQSLRQSLLPGTASWIFDEPKWEAWAGESEDDTVSPILAVSGPRGMGKSHLAASIYDHLKSKASDTTCVVHYYFREDTKDFDEFYNAINWAVVQIAEHNATLCERLNKEMAREDLKWDYDDWEDVWNHFIKPLFARSSKYQLRIVLDGIDELPALVEREELLDCLKTVKDSKDSNISIVCTLRNLRGGNNALLDQLDTIGIETIDVTKEKQKSDTKALIWDRLNSGSGLRRFDPYIKQRIATRVEEVADCMLYAEHVLRHFNMIGREPLVLKQLKNAMPRSLEECFEEILHGLEQRTASSQLAALQTLLAWLAFSFRPLTLADALQLLAAVLDSSLDLESELQGSHLARILKIAGHDERETSDSDIEGLVVNTDENPDAKYDDRDLPLKFLGRSMRDYFQQAHDAADRLRTPAPIAHRKIFLVCCDIICGRIATPNASLRSYAARTWAYHLSWTNITLSSGGDSIACLEGLGNIMTNAHNAVLFFQFHGVDYDEIHSDFTDKMPVKDFRTDVLMTNMAYWADLILKTTSELLSPDTIAWAKDVGEDTKNSFLPLAKTHIKEWLHATAVGSAKTSYKFSRTCIALTGLNTLFKKTLSSGEDPRYDQGEIIGISKAFDDAPKTGNEAWAVAVILEHSRHHDAALAVISGGASDIENTATFTKDFRTLHLLATIQKGLKDNNAAQASITRAISLQDGVSPDHLRQAYITQADIYRNLEDTAEVIKSYEQARQVNLTEPFRGKVLRKEFDAWNDIGKAVDLVKAKWTVHERLEWMTWNYWNDEEHHTDFMLAAIDAKEFDFVVETYEEIINLLDQFDAGVPLRNKLAQWFYLSSGNLDMRKEHALAVLNSTLSSSNGEGYRFTKEDPEYVLYCALSSSTDCIFEQFRFTADKAKKSELYEENKGLMSRPLARAVALQKSWQVHHKVILARMARKLCPLQDFQELLEQGFNDTLDALMDSVAWNDEMNLDLLSQVLASLDGLELEARIALSARFSRIELQDDDGDEKDCDQSPSTDDAGEDDGEEEDDHDEDSDDDDSESDNDEDSDEDQDEEPLPKDEGDLTGDTTYCANHRCDVSWRAWNGRRIYQCVYCWNTYLCESCYEKRITYNSGVDIPPGEHYCGRNHKYVSGPVDGWKGITNGMVTIEGKEPFAFKDWILELKEKKWPEAWENFWAE